MVSPSPESIVLLQWSSAIVGTFQKLILKKSLKQRKIAVMPAVHGPHKEHVSVHLEACGTEKGNAKNDVIELAIVLDDVLYSV